MGAVSAWRVYPVPARGQISNVSALVLPERMPVVDDSSQERQLPMFPGQDPRTDLLIHLLESAVEAVRSLSAINQLLTQKAFDPQHTNHAERVPGTEVADAESKPYLPHQKEFREWSTCRAAFEHLEGVVRRQNKLKPADAVTREMFYAAGGPSPKTVHRIMCLRFGLSDEQWPPSTWPAHPPKTP